MQVRLTVTNEFFILDTGGAPVAVPIRGERSRALANAVLMLPGIARQLVSAGVTRITLAGPSGEGRLPAAVWAMMAPKADQDLERARQEALQVLSDAGVVIDSGVTVTPADGIADALRAVSTADNPFAE